MPRSDTFTRGTKTAPAPLLANERDDDRNAFRRATTDRGPPAAAPCMHSLTECDARRHTPFSPWDRRLVRQHDVRSTPWPAPRRSESPCGSSCDVTRGASDRLLPSHVFVRAPAPRRFPSLRKLTLAWPGTRLLHGRAIHFGGEPAQAGPRASDTPVALLAKGQDRRTKCSRESMRFGTTTRSVFHRARIFAPRRPLERPAPTLAGDAALPPLRRISTPFHPREPFHGLARAGPPSMRPLASGRRASLGP
jgi:hypothetical protein